jgi:hypothetical protein
MEVNDQEWNELLLRVSKHFKVTANYEFVLFAIGVNELGLGFRNFSKDEKMDLMNLGTCVLLCHRGHLERKGTDANGWPLFEPVGQSSNGKQPDESFIKAAMIDYLKNI